MYGIIGLDRYQTVINNVHQSVYRSDAILNIVVRLLNDGAPPKVISELIEEMRTQVDYSETSTAVLEKDKT